MQIPLQITFRGMEPSPALEARIREKADKLERYFHPIIRCHVVVEQTAKHHHQGRLFKVSMDISVPGAEIAISHDREKDHAHEDAYVAIRDAFDAARRRLEDYARKRRRQVKTHEAPPHGWVREIFPEAGYGRIETPDGRLIYFHSNSVLNGGFKHLTVGSEVRFTEEAGDEGPQASTVHPVGKHHPVAP